MTKLAILFMSLALAFVTCLVSWCYYKVLTRGEKSAKD